MKRMEVYLVTRDPTIGSEITKTRLAIIVSPDGMNGAMNTVTVVPLTTGKSCPFRIVTQFAGKDGVAAGDQIRTVDKTLLGNRLGMIDAKASQAVLVTLAEMFITYPQLGTRRQIRGGQVRVVRVVR
jgi:mRNA interferase MazF